MRISDWSSDVCSSDLDKAASQIARIRRLERRVGKALAGAVRRVEILEDGEAFLKVRVNWRFNDLAGRLGHQATHARKLLQLRVDAACNGVRHRVDRIDGRKTAILQD